MKARKRSGSSSPPLALARLQWGRAGEGAETPDSPLLIRAQVGFNGAAPVKARKPRHPRPIAGPDHIGFNGAAPVKARKPDYCHAAQVPVPLLQWGRAGEGAETGFHLDRMDAQKEASMGPRR